MNILKTIMLSILVMVCVSACATVTKNEVVKLKTEKFYDKNGDLHSLKLQLHPIDFSNGSARLSASFEKIMRYPEYSVDVMRKKKISHSFNAIDAAVGLATIPLEVVLFQSIDNSKNLIVGRSRTLSSKIEKINQQNTGRFKDKQTAANGGMVTLFLNGEEVDKFSIDQTGMISIRLQDYSSRLAAIPDVLDVKLIGTLGAKTTEANQQFPWAATLDISSSANEAKIFINGKQHGDAPQTIKVQPGTYQVTLKKDSYATYRITRDLKGGESATVNSMMPPVGCQKGNCKSGWGEMQAETSLYKGQFSAGKQFGYGILQQLDGTALSGIWDEEGLNVPMPEDQLTVEYQRRQSEPVSSLLLEYKNSAARALKERDYKTAKSYFAKIMSLEQKVEVYLYYHYARTLIETGDKSRAAIALKTYLQMAGKSGKYISEAISMLEQVTS